MGVVQLAPKSPYAVIVRMASKSPYTIVVWLASNSLDTVVIQLVSSRHDCYPVEVLNIQCYLWLTFSNFIKTRKGSLEITNKVCVAKAAPLAKFSNISKAKKKKKRLIP